MSQCTFEGCRLSAKLLTERRKVCRADSSFMIPDIFKDMCAPITWACYRPPDHECRVCDTSRCLFPLLLIRHLNRALLCVVFDGPLPLITGVPAQAQTHLCALRVSFLDGEIAKLVPQALATYQLALSSGLERSLVRNESGNTELLHMLLTRIQ